MERTTREETERLLLKVRTAMRLLGLTNREIERRLDYTPSYLTRLFSGQIELRFEHVVEIAAAMGLSADEFFAFAYPPRGEAPGEAAQQLAGLLEELRPTAPPAPTPPLPAPQAASPPLKPMAPPPRPTHVTLELSEKQLVQRIRIEIGKMLKPPVPPKKPPGEGENR